MQPGQQLPTPKSASSGYHIRNARSGKCLVHLLYSGEYLVIQDTCDPNNLDQYWELPDARDSGADFQIRNVLSKKHIATRNAGKSYSVMTTCDSSFDHWKFIPGEGPTLDGIEGAALENVNFSQCLVVDNGRVKAPAYQSDCHGLPEGLWVRY